MKSKISLVVLAVACLVFGITETNVTSAGMPVPCMTNPVVTNSGDSGSGSLRQAILDACDGSTITFDMAPGHVTSPITLSSAELLINKNLTIQGPGANLLTVMRSAAVATPYFRILSIQSSATVAISGLTVSNGRAPDGASGATGGNGGGINNAGNLRLVGLAVSGNRAGNGADEALYNEGAGGGGGGIYNAGTLVMVSSLVNNNQSGLGGTRSGDPPYDGDGGGIYNAGTLVMVSSLVNNNRSGLGGPRTSGLANEGVGGGIFSNSGVLSLINVTISANRARAGGGLWSEGPLSGFPVSSQMINCTVTNNVGTEASDGVFGGGSVGNSIIAHNGFVNVVGIFNSLGHNLVGWDSGGPITCCSFTQPTDQVGTAAAPLDPKLGTLGSNGGPTQTLSPLPGSPAINAGSNALLPADTFDLDGDSDTAEPLPVDQRGVGFPRILGGTVDIGAVESSLGCSPVVSNSGDSGSGSLRQAILDACDGSAITFDMTPGHVTSPITLTSGELLINKNLTIQGPGANLLTVQRSAAPGTSLFRVFDVASGTVAISGLAISNGSTANGANGGPNVGVPGGGVYNAGTLAIDSCVIASNRTGNGGDNSGGVGGAGGDGGGIYNAGTLIIRNSSIIGNQTGKGGSTGVPSVFASTGGSGGGVNNGGILTVIDSSVSGNQTGAGGTGGGSGFGGGGGDGAGFSNSGGLIVANSTITNNQTGSGGSGPSSGLGGGVSNEPGGTIIFTNATISHNTGHNGGGIYNGSGMFINGTVQLANTIVANNVPTTLTGIGADLSGTFQSLGHNLINNDYGGGGFTLNETQNPGTNLFEQEPLLGPLANNGGPTMTRALLPGSPAINAGSNAFIVNPPFSGPPFIDQRGIGFPRIVNSTVDIGAVEVNYAISATAGSGQSTAINTPFGTQLQATVTESGNPASGITVAFTAPGSGATGTFPGNLTTVNVATNASGVATAPVFTANGTAGGPYNVSASLAGGSPAANFALTNLAGNQVITVNTHAPGSATYNTSFTVAATASSGFPVVYSSAGVCTNAGPIFTMTSGVGTCMVKYDQPGNSNYNPAPQIVETVTAQKATQTITFGALANKTFGDPDFMVSATASSGLPVSFSASGQCTVTSPSPGTVHLTGGGSCTITASQAGDATYNAAPDIQQSFNLGKANQTITFGQLSTKKFGDADFSVSATASSGLAVSFTATGNCSVAGNTVHITGAGSCTITASQAGNANYNAAPNVARSFEIDKADQTVSLLPQNLPSRTFGDPDFNVTGGASSDLPVTFSATGNCTVTPGGAPNTATVHLTGAGSCTLTATQAGNANYNPATGSQTFQINKANQTITFGALANKTFGDADFNVSATASSGLAVSFTATGNCTIAGNTVHLTSAGSCTITASQAGDSNYNAAPTVPQSFTIAKANQTITFGALANKTFGDADFNVSATASSGLPVSFTATGNCTISGNTVHLTSAGSCTITASQAGDANFNAAPDVPQSFTIAKAGTTTSLTSSTNPSALGQSVTFTATVNPASNTATGIGTVQFKDGGVNLGIQVVLDASGVAQFTTSTLTAGTHAITAEYSGNTNFNLSTGSLSQVVSNRALLKFSQSGYHVGEDGKFITITVNRSGDLTPAVTVDYASPDDSSSMTFLPCSTVIGIASSRCDFTTAIGTLRFASGETSKTFDVLISQDTYVEGPETFPLTLANPTGGAAFAQPADASTVVTIDDDDSGGVVGDLGITESNPIDDNQNFVRQHYHDFLNREPDAAGLSFWTSQITNCGANQACIDAAKVSVSASFFLSTEFQQTGYYVERTYKSGFGDIAPPTVPVPVRFIDFLRDTQEVGRGIIVGQGQWQAQLDANKRAFALAFVQRADFTARYPAITSATAFVTLLNTNAGNVLTPAEQTALIVQLSPSPADATLRSNVLFQIAENQKLQQQESNRAFVLMEYFGYLRRNPDAAPDSDFTGFNFWLNKLNQANGDFVKAEMVKAFLTSTEYRGRFGP